MSRISVTPEELQMIVSHRQKNARIAAIKEGIEMAAKIAEAHSGMQGGGFIADLIRKINPKTGKVDYSS